MTRRNWIDAFMAVNEKVPTPEVFKLWGGISLLAGALERKVWLTNSIGQLFPNLYIFLIAPPGVGKTIITAQAWRMMKKLRDHKIAPPSVTRATIIEELNNAKRFKQHTTGTLAFNALYICVNELGVLLPEFDTAMMNKLTDIYDGHPYEEARRNKEHSVAIAKPIYNLLAAGTPGYLSTILPEVAWEQGFMSRVLMIYSADAVKQSLFSVRPEDEAEQAVLASELQKIGNLCGEFSFTREAAELIDAFYLGGQTETAQLHPKLQHYNTRRPSHLLKLMMIASVAENDELVITEAHFLKAFEWLTDAEAAMPQIFKAMQSGGDIQIINELWHYVFTTCATKKLDGLPESYLYTFLSQRVQSEKIKWIIEVMKNGNLLRSVIGKDGVLRWAANGNPKR
jgi:hypothetical protein